ncbi:MAG: YidC/Oxa1 family membrane protein insertase [Clostridium sp.]|nr:YidC/Oxa1 family membrane protein insertase [Clostridium sp.]
MGIILKPFAMLLMFLYEFFNSYGIALILFGFIVKLVLFPVTLKSKKSMIQMNMLSGRMNQLKAQYGKNPERYNMEIQKLYEEEKVNPMGGCLWSLIPMFVLIGLYGIIREPLTNMMDLPKDMVAQVAELTGVANTGNYPQIAMVQALNDSAVLASVKAALGDAAAGLQGMDFSFLGMNLADIPSYKFWQQGTPGILMFILVLVSVATSYLSMKVSMSTNQMRKDDSNAQVDQTNKMMTWMMPLMSLWIGFSVPAGLTVYWISQYIMTMLTEVICGKMLKKDYEAARAAAEEAARQAKEDEKRRKEEARLERARRIEEEKLNKKKGIKKDPAQPGVNKDDSREGLRAYARGRAYMPDRFGGVTPYTDPNELIKAEAEAEAAKSKKSSKKDKEEK